MSYSNEGTPAHNEVYELLPWWVNGTLPPDQQARIAGHVNSCSTCQQEIHLLSTLNDGLDAAYNSTHAEGAEVESNLSKVMLRIDAQHSAATETPSIVQKCHQSWTAMIGFFRFHSNSHWLAPALAAGVLFVFIGSWNWYGQQNDQYSVLSSFDSATSRMQLSVRFTSNTDNAEAIAIIRKQSGHLYKEITIESLGAGQYMVGFSDSIELDELSELLAGLQARQNVEDAELR